MKVNGISPNKVINMYRTKSNKGIPSNSKAPKGDRLEISDIGKSLSSFSINKDIIPDEKNIEDIKNKIFTGKYKVKPEEVAKSIMEIIEGKGI